MVIIVIATAFKCKCNGEFIKQDSKGLVGFPISANAIADKKENVQVEMRREKEWRRRYRCCWSGTITWFSSQTSNCKKMLRWNVTRLTPWMPLLSDLGMLSIGYYDRQNSEPLQPCTSSPNPQAEDLPAWSWRRRRQHNWHRCQTKHQKSPSHKTSRLVSPIRKIWEALKQRH